MTIETQFNILHGLGKLRASLQEQLDECEYNHQRQPIQDRMLELANAYIKALEAISAANISTEDLERLRHIQAEGEKNIAIAVASHEENIAIVTANAEQETALAKVQEVREKNAPVLYKIRAFHFTLRMGILGAVVIAAFVFV